MNSRARQILLTQANRVYSIARAIFCFDWRIFAWFMAWVILESGSLNAGEPAGQALPAAGGLLSRNGWHLVTEWQGIQVYNRPWPGSPIPEALARTIIGVPPENLYAVITDYDHFTDFIPYVTRSRILRREGDTCQVRQHLHFPGPLADRHYTIASTQSRPPEAKFRVAWHIVPEISTVSPDAEGVTPSAFSGSWELTPSGNGTATEAEYSIHFEPGGAVPAWLATLAMNRYVPKVVEAVRARALRPATVDTQESNPPDLKQR